MLRPRNRRSPYGSLSTAPPSGLRLPSYPVRSATSSTPPLPVIRTRWPSSVPRRPNCSRLSGEPARPTVAYRAPSLPMPTSCGPNAAEPSGEASDGRRTRGWRTPPSTWVMVPLRPTQISPERPGAARAGSALARLGHEERALADDLQPSRAVHAGGHHGHDRGSCAARRCGRRGEQGHEPRHGRQGQSSKPSSCRNHRAPPERSVGPVTYRTCRHVKPARLSPCRREAGSSGPAPSRPPSCPGRSRPRPPCGNGCPTRRGHRPRHG